MKKFVKILLAALAAAAVIALCAVMIPFILSLREPEKQLEFKSFIESLGFFGVAAMLLLQVLQVVVAIIPGEPIELLMGLMYGTLGGLALTLSGIMIGTLIICLATRRFGMSFARRFVNTDGFSKLKFLKNPERRDFLIFILFFIPGTPKDLLTYFAPFTGIGLGRFLVLSTVARIPSVVSSTLVGATVGNGKLLESLLIFAATGAAGAIGILVNSHLSKKLNNESTDKDEHNENHLQ